MENNRIKDSVLSKEEEQKAKEEKAALKKAEKEQKAAERKRKAEEKAEKKKQQEAHKEVSQPAGKTGKAGMTGMKEKRKAKDRKTKSDGKAKKGLPNNAVIEKITKILPVSGKGKKSILRTLVMSFMVPVTLMIIMGVVSYKTASSAIIDKYKESAIATVSAVGNYCELMCDAISNKALELVTNSDMGEYYNRYYDRKTDKAMEYFRNSNNTMINALGTNSNLLSITVIPESGSFMSTLTGTLPSDAAAGFAETAEGAYFANNPIAQRRWTGFHTYMDEHLSSSLNDYSLVFYQKFSKSKSYLVMDINMKVTLEMLDQMDFGDGTIRALITDDGREIVSVQGEEGISEQTWFLGNEFYEITKDAEEPGSANVKIDGETYVYIYSPVGSMGVDVCALIPQDNLLGQVETIKYLIIVMVILAAGAALATGFFISTGISKTVVDMTTGLSKVAEGDLSKSFTTKRGDEFKILTGSLNSMLESMRVLMKDMKQFGDKVSNLSEDVSDKTTDINTSMQDIARAMEEVAQGVLHQAEDTEESNANMVTLAETIIMVTDKTEDMSNTADKAIDAVEQGKIIVQELSQKSDTTVSITKVLVDDIDEVQRSSAAIKSFVDVINEIAEQTNLLSLNASIEAARAGEAGRGFSVVAEEIRKLADQSNQSGNKIREIVENIGETTNKTTLSAKKAEEMINEQARALEETVAVFAMIQKCVGELVEGIHVVTQSLEETVIEKDNVQGSLQNISAVSQEVAASTEEVTATLGEQVYVIHNLKEQVEKLRADALSLNASIDRFKIEE